LNRYGDLAIFYFLMAAMRHLNVKKFEILTADPVQMAMCVTEPNFVPIGRTDMDGRFSFFSRWRRLSSWIFKSWKF